MTPSQQTTPLGIGLVPSKDDPNSPNYLSPYAEMIPNSITLTDDIYWASKPAAVQALRYASSEQQRSGTANTFTAMDPVLRFYTAQALAARGYVIDREIDAFGNDPVIVMMERINAGISQSAPMGFASPEAHLGSDLPTATVWIKTSTDAKDYPAFYPVPPAPSPSAPAQNVVGPQQLAPSLGSKVFSAGPGAQAAAASHAIVDGETYAENGKTYMTHISDGLMGRSIWFTAAS